MAECLCMIHCNPNISVPIVRCCFRRLLLYCCSSSSQQSVCACSGYYSSNCINLYGHTIARNPKRLGMNFPCTSFSLSQCVSNHHTLRLMYYVYVCCSMPLHMHKCSGCCVYLWPSLVGSCVLLMSLLLLFLIVDGSLARLWMWMRR